MTPSDIVYTLPLGLKRGLRHVDTAQIYGNEAAIGEMLQMSGVPRDELFLATKVWPENEAISSSLAIVIFA
jgi:diketogulonate reductase-like aldo/keto reductase